MSQTNGNHPGGVPLTLNAAQRATILRKAGISAGWVLLSVSEMFNLKKQMEAATAENERLNKQTARLLARSLVHAAIADKSLRSARDLLVALATNSNEPTTRIDALKEVAHIDEALDVLPKPTPQPAAEKEERK